METPPLSWIIGMLAIGFGVVALAKVYGLFFMNGKSPHRVGEAMNVHRAEVVEWSGGEGMVRAGGELWKARSGDALAPGDQVDVKSMKGLVLNVKRMAGDGSQPN